MAAIKNNSRSKVVSGQLVHSSRLGSQTSKPGQNHRHVFLHSGVSFLFFTYSAPLFTFYALAQIETADLPLA